MERYFDAIVLEKTDLPQVLATLRAQKISCEYTIYESNQVRIGFKSAKPLQIARLAGLSNIRELSTEINWQQQWEMSDLDMVNGIVTLPVANKKIYLKPGPGFGDSSHPTTSLMMRHLQKQVYGQRVLDIGCGSGILSLAAAAAGAKEIIGIDIDLPSLAHAHNNLKCNPELPPISFSDTLPELASGPLIVLINMVLVEQEKVFSCYKTLFNRPDTTWLVSGIPSSKREDFFESQLYRSHYLIEEDQLNGWSIFIVTL